MDPEDVVAQDFQFRSIAAYPSLEPGEKQSLHTLTQANTVAKRPRIPTIIHFYDSC